MTERGLFIVLEGIDNCGKTTQAKMLEQYFKEQGLPVMQTREPGGTAGGEEIREVLVKNRPKMLHPLTQTLLFYGARNEFLVNLVEPNILRGVNCITDRHDASTHVYQGWVQGVDLNIINNLRSWVVESRNCAPDLYAIIDITAEESFRRDQNKDNQGQVQIYEKQGLEFREKLREGYIDFAMNSEAVILDGMKSKESIHNEIISLVEQLRNGK